MFIEFLKALLAVYIYKEISLGKHQKLLYCYRQEINKSHGMNIVGLSSDW